MQYPETPELDANIKALEATDCSAMSELEFKIHSQTIKDAYWHRRRVKERLAGEEPTII